MMNRVSFVLFFKKSRPGLVNILRAHTQIIYKFRGNFFSRAHRNFEEYNVLEYFTIIINYFTIIINADYS